MILIGCGKSKRREASTAGELYTGGLFAARREYAERCTEHWYILSAKFGVIHPSVVVSPYDCTIRQKPQIDQVAWCAGVISQICDLLPDNCRPRDCKIEVHAGEDYADPLVTVLCNFGFRAEWPVRGLGIGEQLAWYKSYDATRRYRRDLEVPA